MKCSQCGAENEDGFKFCGVCGVPLFIPKIPDNASMSNDQSKPQCPYCATVLSVLPKRKKPCPQCGKQIYVRKGILRTEDDASIEDWLNRLGFLNLTRNDFDVQREILSEQFGCKAAVDDTIWRILNQQVKGSDLQKTKLCYFEMARLVGVEGKDPKPFIVEAHRAELYYLKSQGVKTVTVLGCNDDSGCRKCKKLGGKRFAIGTAINEMPIPGLCVDEGGCRCTYVPTRRSNGLLGIE